MLTKTRRAYEVTTIKARISNIKVKELPDGNVAFVCAASATPDGQLSNPVTAKKPYSSAKVYTSLFVRHWDEWLGEDTNSLWYTALEKKNGRFTTSGRSLINALAGSKLESPVPPFGGTGDFDISSTGLVFVAKDPELNQAIYTKTDLYYVPLKTFTEEHPPSPKGVETPGLEGYTNSPVFSHCGCKVAFTRMKSKQYESDKPRLMLLPDIIDLSKTEEFFATDDGEGAWDYRPESILWSTDDKTLYVTAEKNARVHLWEVPSNPADAKDTPSVIKTADGSVNDIRLLAESDDSSSKLLVSSTSLVDNSCYSIVDPSANTTDIVSSNSKQGKTFGLTRSSIGDIKFKGAGDYDVHALVVRPSNFDEKKRYPLCFLIHGGPQGAWQDGWSNRWNPAVFAEQGYVVVSPNPTGSTGYGMALQNGIKGQWGGRPYEDLVKAFEYIEKNMPYVDTDRAVALGASYGGYMISKLPFFGDAVRGPRTLTDTPSFSLQTDWIQGHPLGRKFKALVCHDGVFSTLNQYSSEELFFPIHDFEGTIYDNRAAYEKWDPAQHVNEWATPQLVSYSLFSPLHNHVLLANHTYYLFPQKQIIHSELDYRLPVTEGIAPFNILQSKGIPSKLVMFPDENHVRKTYYHARDLLESVSLWRRRGSQSLPEVILGVGHLHHQNPSSSNNNSIHQFRAQGAVSGKASVWPSIDDTPPRFCSLSLSNPQPTLLSINSTLRSKDNGNETL